MRRWGAAAAAENSKEDAQKEAQRWLQREHIYSGIGIAIRGKLRQKKTERWKQITY